MIWSYEYTVNSEAQNYSLRLSGMSRDIQNKGIANSLNRRRFRSNKHI